MTEQPLTPQPIPQEHPIKDPHLFLLHKANWAFLNGERPTPKLQRVYSGARTGIPLMLFGFILFAAIVSTINTLQTPNSTALLVTGTLYGFLGILIAYGLYNGLKQRPEAITGVVLEGEVIQSEKVWVPGEYLLGVRYRFTTPGGIPEVGEAKGFARLAGDSMAPAPGTQVRIYFTLDGKQYLL